MAHRVDGAEEEVVVVSERARVVVHIGHDEDDRGQDDRVDRACARTRELDTESRRPRTAATSNATSAQSHSRSGVNSDRG